MESADKKTERVKGKAERKWLEDFEYLFVLGIVAIWVAWHVLVIDGVTKHMKFLREKFGEPWIQTPLNVPRSEIDDLDLKVM